MSPSLVDLARQELEEHNVEVDEPSRTRAQEDLKMMDVIEGGSIGEGLSAASYDMLTDTVNLYQPMAKAGAVDNVLTDEQIEEVVSLADSEDLPPELQQSMDDAFKSIDSAKSAMENMGLDAQINQSAEQVSSHTAIYDALRKGVPTDKVDEQTREELREEARWQLQISAEHELVHKAATDAFVEHDGRTGALLENLREITEIEQGLLYDEKDRDDKKDVRALLENKESQFPLNDQDLRRAAVMELDDGYEQKKQEVKEKIELLESERDRTEEMLEERTETWSDIITEDRNDILGKQNEVRDAYRDFQAEFRNFLEENDEKSREDYREFLKEHDLYTPERVERLMDAEDYEEAFENKKDEQIDRFKEREDELYEELEEYLDERADELEEEIKEYIEPMFERAEANSEVPVGSVGESFAHFWTMYRRGELEDEESREQKKEGLRRNYPNGGDRAAEVIDDLFQQYDEMDGSEEDRVSYVMSQQEEYLEREMEPGLMDAVTERLPDSDYLPF